MKDVLDRVRSSIGPKKKGGLIGVKDEWRGSSRVLLAGSVEGLDRGTVVAASEPSIASPELELRDIGVLLDGFDGFAELGDIYVVDDSGFFLDCGLGRIKEK